MSSRQRFKSDRESLTVRWYLLLLALGFVVIFFRLVYLQALAGTRYQLASLGNILQTVETIPPRGGIFDRAGRPLAVSKNIFALLYIAPVDVEDYFPTPEETEQLAAEGRKFDYLNKKTHKSLREVQRLSAYLGIPYDDLMERLQRERRRVYGYEPVTLVDELTEEQKIYIGEHQADFEGFFIEQYAFKREYPMGRSAAHVIGYTGFVGDTDPLAIRNMGYGARETVGKEGVERQYESILHGRSGRRDIEVDRNRVFRKEARMVPPERGEDIYLTLDKNIQAEAFALLDNRPGAIIISNLAEGHEGEILAMAASPSYDPGRFDEPNYYAGLLNHPDLPLLNRAYRNAFPPGSTFKIVTATAAFQTGVAVAGSTYYCTGHKQIGNREFKCHKLTGHGRVTALEAISQSCDVALYDMALALPQQQETLHNFAQFFGFGEPTGIDLPNEASGVVPDKKWKRDHYAGERWHPTDRLWYDGDTANFAIGQGFLTATPLQVLWSAQVVALDGYQAEPHLLYARKDRTGVTPVRVKPLRRVPVDKDALNLTKQGMRLAVTNGTCTKLNLQGLSVCAKSGTAETGRKGERDHSWVVGFFPANKPQYGFVAFFQNGGGAGDAAVPAMRQMLTYLRDDYQPGVSEEGDQG